MQFRFTASEIDLNDDRLSCMFSETVYEGYQDDSTRTGMDELTSATMLASRKPSMP